MTETSFPWGYGIGDGNISYDQTFMQTLLSSLATDGDFSSGDGVILRGVGSEYAFSGATSPCVISPGASIYGTFGVFHISDANVNVVIPTPAGATRKDRIFVEYDAVTATSRINRVAGVEGGAAPLTGLGVDICTAIITTGGAITYIDKRLYSLSASAPPCPLASGGRLTASSIGPFNPADVYGASAIYLHPCASRRIYVYAGGSLRRVTIPTNGVALSLGGLASDTLYDIFAYINSYGVLALEAVAWGSSGPGTSTRASSLGWAGGLQVKSDDPSRTYVGTIKTVAAGTTEDSYRRRYVWSYSNRVKKHFAASLNGAWFWGSEAFRPPNYDLTDGETRAGIVVGDSTTLVEAMVLGTFQQNNPDIESSGGVGFGLNSIEEAQNNTLRVGSYTAGFPTYILRHEAYGLYSGYLPAGYNFLQHLEIGLLGNTASYFVGGTTLQRPGLIGSLLS